MGMVCLISVVVPATFLPCAILLDGCTASINPFLDTISRIASSSAIIPWPARRMVGTCSESRSQPESTPLVSAT